MLKTLFLGTPSVAVPFLDLLLKKTRVLGVLTAPDKPAGRGYETAPPPVKAAALAAGAPVFQPASLKGPEPAARMAEWGEADLGVAVAYGRLVPPEIFSKPRFGMLNVHFSLLPKYRGAAPVQWALIRGEKESGVTIFRIEAGLDTGPVYLQRSVSVEPEDTSLSLRARLAGLGLELLEEALDRFTAGGCPAVPQSGEPSAAPALKKEDGRLSWGEQSAEEAANLIRGTYEWPQAYCLWKGRPLKIRAARPAGDTPGLPGQVTSLEKGLGFFVKCRSGALLVRRVQPEGRKEMAAEDFWNGARLSGGDRFE